MARRYTVSEAIDYTCDHHTGEEERGQECEDGLEEEVSENEDDTECTDGEESSDEEDGHAEAVVTLRSKNGNIS